MSLFFLSQFNKYNFLLVHSLLHVFLHEVEKRDRELSLHQNENILKQNKRHETQAHTQKMMIIKGKCIQKKKYRK